MTTTFDTPAAELAAAAAELAAAKLVWAAEDAAALATDNARVAFEAFIASLPAESRDDIEHSAWGNSFTVEVHAEYADDLERWTVALGTARDLADNLGLL